MSNASEDLTALEMVRLGYAVNDSTDQARVLDFRVRFHSAEVAADACRAIDSYNDFDGAAVGEALRQIGERVESATFYVGREMSPVVYVRTGWGDEKVQAVALGLLREVGPDELDVGADGMVRAWWD